MIRFSDKKPSSFYKYTFSSAERAEQFCLKLLEDGISSINTTGTKRVLEEDGQFYVYLTAAEHTSYEKAKQGIHGLDVFPESLREAVRWAQKEIFQYPYPYLKAWTGNETSVDDIPEGFCPKQLTRFETELDCGYGRTVVRPNHGMAHSMRVSNYMAQVCELFKKYSPDTEIQKIVNDPRKVRILQTMMLFSVSGRVNEAGKAGYDEMNHVERQLSQRNYEESRHYSAENFKRYCKESGLVDVNSEEFEQFYHAMRYMERRNDPEHNWNRYIHLMSLTHSMDLMRCFPKAWMEGLANSFASQFKRSDAFKQNPEGAMADIFNVLGNITKSQMATGNRVMTAIDPQSQTFYSVNQYYNHDLFYQCTNDVDFAMDRLAALQSPVVNPDATAVLPGVYSVNYNNDSTVSFGFNSAHDAKLFANILFQEGLVDYPLEVTKMASGRARLVGVSVHSSLMDNIDRFVHYVEDSPQKAAWEDYQARVQRGDYANERGWLKYGISIGHAKMVKDLINKSVCATQLLQNEERYSPLAHAQQVMDESIIRMISDVVEPKAASSKLKVVQ